MLDIGKMQKTAWLDLTIEGVKVKLKIKALTQGELLKYYRESREKEDNEKTDYARKFLFDLIVGWENISLEGNKECSRANIEKFINTYGGIKMKESKVTVKVKSPDPEKDEYVMNPKTGEIVTEEITEIQTLSQRIQGFSGEIINEEKKSKENLGNTSTPG